MKKTIGNILLLTGSLFVLFSFLLFWHNRREASFAKEKSQAVIPRLAAQIDFNQQQTNEENMAAPFGVQEDEGIPMIELEGENYIGYLTIPDLGLQLPVFADWSKPKLKIAPCRYMGSVEQENLVIMGHNYSEGFGELSQLKTGEKVYFKDAVGQAVSYEVVAVEVLSDTDVEEMTQSGYDLTLFTCTYNGKNRLAVRCQESAE